MKILRVIARLMDYPDQAVRDNAPELRSAIEEASQISPEMRAELRALLDGLCDGDLLDVQEQYTGLFDRGRSLSLLLFEHVHGESRDRGQAMVDLLEEYFAAGYEVTAQELPDFIPMYLEFLSTRDDLDARVGLVDISHILGVLCARLHERPSQYCSLFDALIMISGVEVELPALREQVRGEPADDTPEALDRDWEEQEVKFGGEQSAEHVGDGMDACNPSSVLPVLPCEITDSPEQPLKWVDPSAQIQRSA